MKSLDQKHKALTYAMSHLSVVPVRHSASNRSEQISQLLFGELVELLEPKGKQWYKIRCTWDNCVGWVQTRQICQITNSEYEHYSNHYAYCLDLFQPLRWNDHLMVIPIGARLPDFDGIKFRFNNNLFTYSGQAVAPENLDARPDILIKVALRYLHAPFMWGGRSPLGIDSAGFVQMAFKLIGIHLPRDCGSQVSFGTDVDFIEQTQTGDIAFFENNLGNINHCGLLLPEGRIIHVAESVRIDKIDHYGIFDVEKKIYSYKLRIIKRLLEPVSQTKTNGKAETKNLINQVALFED